MIKIEIQDKGIFISEKALEFPISIKVLKQLLGEARYMVLKYGHKHTWDKLGILGHSRDGELIENLYISFIEEDFEFSPDCIFIGEILIDGKDILEFRKNNLDKLIKSNKYDTSGKFVKGKISCWFDIDAASVKGILIQNDDGENYEHPLISARQIPISINEKYNYLIDLWEKWKKEILNIISINNPYFNLEYGISDSDVKRYTKLKTDINIPDELIAFYKIYNVAYNAVTSAVCFSVNGWHYDLIPFKQIREEWVAIQDINADFPEPFADNLEGYSPKVKAMSYASPLWVPFAEGKNGDYLLYDTDPNENGIYGQIIELKNESWERTVVANSLTELIETEINQLKNGVVEMYDFIVGKE